MDNAPRKASEIIVSLEQKVEQLIKSNNSLDLNIKILSNKLNKVLEVLQNVNVAPNLPVTASATPTPAINMGASNSYSVSALIAHSEPPPNFANYQMDEKETVMIQKEETLPIADEVVGFRRTSRPDATKNIAPPTITAPYEAQVEVSNNMQADAVPKVAVQQRVVDKNNKAVYLANVEITNVDTRQVIYKGRTTGVGRWAAPLPAGTYQVSIKRLEPGTNQKLENFQTLKVDGASPQLNLPTAII